MGKKSAAKDRGYMTATEWKVDGGGYRDKTEGIPFRRLPSTAAPSRSSPSTIRCAPTTAP